MGDGEGKDFFDPAGEGEGAGNAEPSTDQPSGESQEEQGENVEPKVVTEDILNQRLQEFERKVQSSRDSALSSLDKRYKRSLEAVDQAVERLKKAGDEVKPETVERMRQQAVQEAMISDASDEPSGQDANARPNDQQDELTKRVNARAAEIVNEFGLETITKEDPEWRLVEQKSGPDAFLASFRNACFAKAQRTQAEAPPPEARIPSTATASGPPPKGAAAQFLKEYRAAQGKGLRVAREIREKYLKQNVDVDGLISENF